MTITKNLTKIEIKRINNIISNYNSILKQSYSTPDFIYSMYHKNIIGGCSFHLQLLCKFANAP